MLKRFSIFVSSAILVAAALHADNIVDEIVARVNDQIITRSDYQRAVAAAQDELKHADPSGWQGKWPEAQKNILRDLVDRELLVSKGKELGITGDTEVVKRLDDIRKSMNLKSMEDLEKAAQEQGVSFEDFKDQIRTEVITRDVLGREVGSHIQVSSDEIKKWYDQHQKELEGPETVALSEILISTEPKAADNTPEAQASEPDPAKVAAAQAKAQQVLDMLSKGTAFEDLARRFSDGSTAAQGGALGEFKRGELAKELEDKTFPLKTGDHTGVIRTKQGFIILKVTDHRPAGIPPLPSVEEKIRDAIFSDKFPNAAREYLTKLREQAYIDIKTGYQDTGASPNQTKPQILASADQASKPEKDKRHKKLGIF